MRAPVWLVAAMMTVALAGCGPQGKVTVGKTHGGVTTYFTEWRHIEPSELRFNIGDLPNANVTEVTQRMRDSRILHQRVLFDNHGRLLMQHMLGPSALFILRVTKDTNDFAKIADEYKEWIGFRSNEAEANKKRIYSRGIRGGWLTTVPVDSINRDCILSRVGFLSRADKNRTSDEHYDTIVWFRDCSGKRTEEEVMDFLKGLKIVSPA